MLNKVAITAAGQQLYFVSSTNKGAGSGLVTVKKMGRLWASLSNGHRASIKDVQLDCGDFNSPGTLYVNQQAHEDYLSACIALSALKNSLGYGPRPGVTTADIRQASALLRLDAGAL